MERGAEFAIESSGYTKFIKIIEILKCRGALPCALVGIRKIKIMKVTLYSDGGSRGNPGPAGIGVVLEFGGKIEKFKKYIGEATNNQAEYQALIFGLEKARDLGAKELEVFLDSELLVKQARGQYKVKNDGLKPLFAKVLSLTNKFENISFHHVVRAKNELADELVNEAVDEAVKA